MFDSIADDDLKRLRTNLRAKINRHARRIDNLRAERNAAIRKLDDINVELIQRKAKQ